MNSKKYLSDDNYSPLILGVSHTIEHLVEVKSFLDEIFLVNKSVLIEVRPYTQQDVLKYSDHPTTRFWLDLIDYLNETEASIIYFDEGEEVSRRANQRYTQWVESQQFPSSDPVGQYLSIKYNKFLDIYAEEFNPVFSEKILREKPLVIVAGNEGHANPVYHELLRQGINARYVEIPTKNRL